jgi:1-aminocyclopropane-1-carboxylate deaminase
LLSYQPTPIVQLRNELLDDAGVKLFCKREDLNHPAISGNKWWKLKYNLEEATRQEKKILLTFGGAYSNHIYATAAASYETGFKSVGIIRGEETLPLNKTLAFAQHCSMKLHYVSRTQYREKNNPEFIQELYNRFGDFYLIPEGGTNELAVKGSAEFGKQLAEEIDFDYLCLPVGTGGTIAGIIAGLEGKKEVIGFPVLKGGDFLKDEIEKLLQKYSNTSYGNWHLDASYHHGGYAKATPALLDFVKLMNDKHNLPLDAVYTGKLLWAVMDYVRQGKFRRGSTVLVVHTGGLQAVG